jgi:hypothetical protein
MNWDAISAIAELLGAFAVLISILYLANQIRQSTEVARSTARQGIAEAAMGEASSIIENADLAQLMFREISGEPLEAYENYRIQLFAFRSLRFYENCHYQYRTGMLEDDEWGAFRHNLALLLELKLYNQYWAGHTKLFTPIFRDLVEEIRSELKQSDRLGTSGTEILAIDPRDRQ